MSVSKARGHCGRALLALLMAEGLVACNSQVSFAPLSSLTCETSAEGCSAQETEPADNQDTDQPAGNQQTDGHQPEDQGGSTPAVEAVEQTLSVKSTNKVDILFIVDSSGSMALERESLGRKLSAFVGQLQGIDWQLCVTTTDIGRENGRLLRFGDGSYVLTSASANASTLFLNRLTSISNGSGDEQGVAAISAALDRMEHGCVRSDAALATVVLSDEDERSTGGYSIFMHEPSFEELLPANYPENLVAKIESLWGGDKPFTAHSIVIPSTDAACYDSQARDSAVWYGTRYEQLSSLTGGIIGNICASDYSSQLTNFASRIRGSLSMADLDCEPLGDVEVDVSPRPAGFATRVVGNKLYFEPSLPSDTQVTLRYQCEVH